jgi:hypothetical protein
MRLYGRPHFFTDLLYYEMYVYYVGLHPIVTVYPAEHGGDAFPPKRLDGDVPLDSRGTYSRKMIRSAVVPFAVQFSS